MRVINRGPFASNNRDAGTAEENKAVSQGTISHFGTYTVDEGGKTLSFHVEGSSFPNWEHTIQRTTGHRHHGRSADLHEPDIIYSGAGVHAHRAGLEEVEVNG